MNRRADERLFLFFSCFYNTLRGLITGLRSGQTQHSGDHAGRCGLVQRERLQHGE
jgi:hypothetical protein